MFCGKCGNKVSFYYEEVGLDENKKMLYKKFQLCKNCNEAIQVPLDYPNKELKVKKKNSVLSIISTVFAGVALFMSIFSPLTYFFILVSVILAFIDIGINNPNESHFHSYDALLACIITILLIIFVF